MTDVRQAPKLALQKATEKDIPLIHDLAHKIWPQAYSKLLSIDKINYMLELFYSEASLQKQIKEHHTFLIVYDETVPTGFASYSEIEKGVFKLHKIYILPTQQGKGTGRFLIENVIKNILPHGAQTLQLNVNRQNRAKDFYEKLGFIVIKEVDVDIGHGHFMNDYVMEKKIN